MPKQILWSNQNGFILLPFVFFLILLIVSGVGFYFYQTKSTEENREVTQSTIEVIIPTPPSSIPIPPPPPPPPPPIGENEVPVYEYNLVDALKNADAVTDLTNCDAKVRTIPSTIGNLTKLQHVDLSENLLTTLPTEINKLTSLKELILTNNNFSKAEQLRIKKLLPNTQIAFIPQKGFNPYISNNWIPYTNAALGSFKYHPELQVKEEFGVLSISNDLVGLKRAFASCSVEKAYISMKISLEENKNNLSPVSYLEKIWDIKITQQGNTYVVDKQEAEMKMIGKITNYKNGDIDGVIADAGESEHPTIISSHNGKFYIFQYLSGGETGSGIATIAKQTLEQTLATFKYPD